MEVLLSADDYSAELAEHYGWINRALPAADLGDFVSRLAHRIARFPAAGHAVVKERINAVALASAEDFNRDGDLFSEGVRNREAQGIVQAAMKNGLQTRNGELTLTAILG
jgi:enoyl-CoA hydratase/carnithine racemase